MRLRPALESTLASAPGIPPGGPLHIRSDPFVSIDVLFKKYFSVLVGALVALSAYLQASGISDLARAAWVPAGGIPLQAMPQVQLDPIAPPSVALIHERNPFDYQTRPLLAEEPAPEEPTEPEEVVVDDPLLVPLCSGVEVLILTESDDPLWSFAAIKEAKGGPTLRRVGDKVSGMTVAYIGYNPATASPTVWLEGTTLCQAALFHVDLPETKVAAQVEPEAAPVEQPEPAPAAAGSRAVDPDIASKIKRISETEFEIDRSAVDKILDNQAELMRSARIVPEQKDGQTIGVRMFGIRPETLLGQLGLVNGDRLEAINGFNMGSPEKALEAYARLRTANSLKIQVNRRGKPMTIELKIK